LNLVDTFWQQIPEIKFDVKLSCEDYITKELHALYSPNIIRVIKSNKLRLAGHVAHMGERRGAYKVLMRKPERRRPLRKFRRKWEDNIETDLREVGWRTSTGSIWLRLGTRGGLL
jgi:hypothetical protein